jgi:hypothetical protein
MYLFEEENKKCVNPTKNRLPIPSKTDSPHYQSTFFYYFFSCNSLIFTYFTKVAKAEIAQTKKPL